MAKDERLYARFDIGMDEHPKVMLLSDAAFRALIEGTLYARRQLTDGFLREAIVVKKWGREVIPELTANDPERPSWQHCEKEGVKGFQIHDFGKHQTTTADIEKKRESGRLGGLAKAKRMASNGLARASDSVEQKASTTLAKTETETETKTTTPKGVGRATRLPTSWTPSAACQKYAHENRIDIQHEIGQFRAHADANARVQKDWDGAFRQWLGNAKKWTKETGKGPVVVPPRLNGPCAHRFVGGYCAECSMKEGS